MKKACGSIVTMVLVGSMLLIPSCGLIDNEIINEVCTTECTTITGRFTTEDNKPVAGLALTLGWGSHGAGLKGLGGESRKIMTGETDENGNYRFSFYAKDKELIEGNFSVTFHAPEEKYFVIMNNSFFGVYDIKKRDTVAVTDYYLPKRGATLILRLVNPEAIKGDDRVIADASYTCVMPTMKCGTTHSLSSGEGSEATINTAANQYTYVSIIKRINGEFTTSMDSLFIAANQTRIYEVKF